MKISMELLIILFSFSRILSVYSLFNDFNQGVKCNHFHKFNFESGLLKNAEEWKPLKNQTSTDFQIYQNLHKNCDKFLLNQNYFLNLSKTEEEKQFPIAFSIVTFKSASQIERLLRMIYRPWNYYCIHIDTKSSKEFVDAIDELVKCLNSKFNNIINTANRVDVQWGKMSVLTADLNCMKELHEKYKDWKYLINLTGQEFPLKTNAELVKILKAYKGANNLEGTYKRRNEERVPTLKMPFPIIWYKGSVHITVNRDFVAFILESPISKDVLTALNGRQVPDEQFFATLNHNPQFRIRGSFIGDPDENVPGNEPLFYFLTRYKNWGEYSCESKLRVRAICIWGVGDLPKLVNAPHLFANKFYEDFQPATLKCLERWYYDKVDNELKTGQISINTTFYSNLPFVINRYNPL